MFAEQVRRVSLSRPKVRVSRIGLEEYSGPHMADKRRRLATERCAHGEDCRGGIRES